MKPTSRRKFMTQSCPLLIASVIGAKLLTRCSPEALEKQTPIEGGYSLDGSILSIDLDYPDFAPLQTQGWINFQEQKVLLLKSNDSYNAFTNKCPHEGTRDQWKYVASNNTFFCGNHDKSYKTDCKTPGSGGVLKCYETQRIGNQLKVYLK